MTPQNRLPLFEIFNSAPAGKNLFIHARGCGVDLSNEELLDAIDEYEQRTVTVVKATPPTRVKSRRSTARSKETWRIIAEYPDYEVSSQGRVRSLKRVDATAVLAPHWRRFGKMWVPYYALYKAGKKNPIQAGWLRSAAGF